MSISSRSSFSPYIYNPITIRLIDHPQSRYPFGISIPEKPVRPSPPTIEPVSSPKVDAVPEDLHEDALFQVHIDPISYEPILDPVADKNEPKHIYERATIVRWLKDHPTSPLTRRPMTEADLVPVPELKEQINEKIREYLLKKQPELLQKYKEKVEKANKQYQIELDLYHKVDLPQYINECQSLPLNSRVSLVALRSFTELHTSVDPDLSREIPPPNRQITEIGRKSICNICKKSARFTSSKHIWKSLRNFLII